MNTRGFKKRGPQQNKASESTESERGSIAPGKVTRASKLGPPQAAAAEAPSRSSPAPVQQKQEPAGTAREERTALTKRWLDTAVRPDIYPPPVQMHGGPPPVQMYGGGSAPGDDVHQLAAHGLSGSASALPHLDQIQRAFGQHDVSGVKAHVAGHATEASQAMGAQAYATGNHVAFRSAPDLHTAAHEAAHVVQQRAGVQLGGGVGQAGDSYERHADAVADRVVRGESAESLLDAHAGGSRPAAPVSGGAPVQLMRELPGTAKKLAALTPEQRHEVDQIQDQAEREERIELLYEETLRQKTERTQPDGYYPGTVTIDMGSGKTTKIERSELGTAIRDSAPSEDSVAGVIRALGEMVTESNESKLGPVIQTIRKLCQEVEVLPKEHRDIATRAFVNVYKQKANDSRLKDKTKLAVILKNVLQKAVTEQTQRPEIVVGGEAFVPEKKPSFDHLKPGVHMSMVEQDFDVLARKSGGRINSVHEVDMAFLDETRGISDYRATIGDKGLDVTGGDARGEKVFAVGHRGAVGFEGKLTNIGGERYYAVLFPKGFIARYGLDLRTAGSSGKSAKTPNDEEFAQKRFRDNDKEIQIPDDRAFAMRAEDSTPDGQVHMHFGWTKMNIHGEQMSHIQFFRSFVVGVVEFSSDGVVMHFKTFG